MKRLIATLVLVCAAAVTASADVYIKTKNHTDAMEMMGQSQPATDTVSEQWIGDGVFAMTSEKVSSIMDFKKKTGVMILNAAKSYVEFALPLDITKLLPAEAVPMMSMMKMTVAVTPTGEKKTIGSWPCTRYDVSIDMGMMAMTMQIWASTEVGFDASNYMKDLFGSTQPMMMMDAAGPAELGKIKGLMIASDMSMGGMMHATSEVVEIAKKPAPAGTYAVPKGFVKKDQLTMQDLMAIR